MIEDSTHSQQVKEIYKEEIKQEEDVIYECNPGTPTDAQQEEQKQQT